MSFVGVLFFFFDGSFVGVQMRAINTYRRLIITIPLQFNKFLILVELNNLIVHRRGQLQNKHVSTQQVST